MKKHYDCKAWANARLERRCNSASRIYIYVVVQFSSCFELSRNSLLHVTFTFLCFIICRKQKRFRKKIEQQHTCIDALTEKKKLANHHIHWKRKNLNKAVHLNFIWSINTNKNMFLIHWFWANLYQSWTSVCRSLIDLRKDLQRNYYKKVIQLHRLGRVGLVAKEIMKSNI